MGTTSDLLDDVGKLLATPVVLEGYLGRKGRAVVARLRLDDGRTVIAKGGRPLTDDGHSADPWSPVNRFHNEVAALQTLDGADGLVPKLLAFDLQRSWMVLEDLGDTKSLADALLGSDPGQATTVLSAWASVLGQLHHTTSNGATLGQWRANRGALGALPATESAIQVLSVARGHLEGIVSVSVETEEAATVIDRRLSDQRWWAMTPRDACPDNCAVRSNGSVTLFDFEGGGIRHALLDADYLVAEHFDRWSVFTAKFRAHYAPKGNGNEF